VQRKQPCALGPFRPLARPARGHGPRRGPASGSGRRRMRALSRALSLCAPHTERELSEAPPVRAAVPVALVPGPPPARLSSSRMAAPSPRVRPCAIAGTRGAVASVFVSSARYVERVPRRPRAGANVAAVTCRASPALAIGRWVGGRGARGRPPPSPRPCRHGRRRH